MKSIAKHIINYYIEMSISRLRNSACLTEQFCSASEKSIPLCNSCSDEATWLFRENITISKPFRGCSVPIIMLRIRHIVEFCSGFYLCFFYVLGFRVLHSHFGYGSVPFMVLWSALQALVPVLFGFLGLLPFIFDQSCAASAIV